MKEHRWVGQRGFSGGSSEKSRIGRTGAVPIIGNAPVCYYPNQNRPQKVERPGDEFGTEEGADEVVQQGDYVGAVAAAGTSGVPTGGQSHLHLQLSKKASQYTDSQGKKITTYFIPNVTPGPVDPVYFPIDVNPLFEQEENSLLLDRILDALRAGRQAAREWEMAVGTMSLEIDRPGGLPLIQQSVGGAMGIPTRSTLARVVICWTVDLAMISCMRIRTRCIDLLVPTF